MRTFIHTLFIVSLLTMLIALPLALTTLISAEVFFAILLGGGAIFTMSNLILDRI